MSPSNNLAIFILACQAMASVLMTLAYLFDRPTFEKLEKLGTFWIPGLIKLGRLLRNTNRPLMMGLYFLSLVFVVFSYAAAILLVIQFIRQIF